MGRAHLRLPAAVRQYLILNVAWPRLAVPEPEPELDPELESDWALLLHPTAGLDCWKCSLPLRPYLCIMSLLLLRSVLC